jgi:hypothetical protein
VVHGTRDKHDPARKWYTGEDLQRVQKLEDDVNGVTIALDGNIEVMSSITAFYEGLVEHRHWNLPASCSDSAKLFSKETRNTIYELRMQIARSRALAKHTMERKHLVGYFY